MQVLGLPAKVQTFIIDFTNCIDFLEDPYLVINFAAGLFRLVEIGISRIFGV